MNIGRGHGNIPGLKLVRFVCDSQGIINDKSDSLIILSGYLIVSSNMPVQYANMSRLDEEMQRFVESNDTVLHLSYCNLKEFPQVIFETDDCRRLRRIFAKNCSIKTLPSEIGSLTNLVELYLPYNKLKELPSGIAKLVNLQSLDCCNNNLTSFSRGLCHLPSLERLKLSFNMLTALPEDICHLQNLQVLEVMNNKLRAIPRNISKCPNLVRCLLDRNDILCLPPEISHSPKLEELSVASNKLICLPQDIGRYNKLKKVFVNNNPYLHALPVGLGFQEIGVSGGVENFYPSLDLEHRYRWVDIKGKNSVTKRIFLPLGTKRIGDIANKFVPSLFETSLIEVHLSWKKGCYNHLLPQDVLDILSCPLAHCNTCRRPIFTEAFPVIFEGQIRLFELFRVALCCSWKCARLSSLIIQLPLVYPDPSLVNLPVALIDQN